jgi:hypothetical protein
MAELSTLEVAVFMPFSRAALNQNGPTYSLKLSKKNFQAIPFP